LLTDQEMHDRMVNGWPMGRPETVCGNGSLRRHSEKSRVWLPKVCAEYGIQKVCDAGAGDLWYAKGIDWTVDYRAFDLITRDPSVIERDITRKALPKCDAILCRMVLNHLDDERILMALALFRRSAKYLIATQFNGQNLPKRSPQFTRLDLRREPYSLGEPLSSVQDGVESTCALALWKL
jgi:hypothetical protein